LKKTGVRLRPMVRVTNYQIQLDRPNGVYVSGEDVTGTLHLTVGSDINCRGVRLKLSGSGYVHWHTGSGDDRNDYYGRKEYVSKSMTVLGNFHRTTCIPEAGENAFFDPNNGGGEIIIPLDDGKVDNDFVLAVRSMDYDFGRKDDLLGETLVHVARDLLATPGVKKSFNLRRKGSFVSSNNNVQSEVTLSAHVEELIGKYFLRLTCYQTTGLRKADFFGKNDVYVQCYRVAPGTDESVALPQPQKNFTMPAGSTYSIPFSMKLPLKYLPSSFSTNYGDSCYVNYSMYSNIDIALWRDPSTRRYITVLSSELPSPSLFGPMLRPVTAPQTIYGCDCCCFTCCEKGNAAFRAAIDKTYLAPGDAIFITAFAENNTEDPCGFVVSLKQEATMQAHQRSRRVPIEYKLVEETVPPGGTLEWSATNPKMAIIPAVPPTFQAGRATAATGHRNWRDPLSWYYVISVKMDMPGFFATDIYWNVPVTVGVFSVHSLKEMDPAKYGGTVEVVQAAGIAEDDLPPAFDEPDYPPPSFETTGLVNSAVPITGEVRAPEGEINENKYNVGGAPPIYAPAYPSPQVKCTVNENLPNCR